MKKVLFICILMLSFLLGACGEIAKTAYGIQNANDAPIDPSTASGATITYKKDGTALTNVIDLEYDKENHTVHYVRRDGTAYISGVAPYNEVEITAGSGYLTWNTKDEEWEYTDAGRVYGIYQQKYLPITITGQE